MASDIVGSAKVIIEGDVDQSSFDSAGSKIGSALKKGAVVGVAALGTLAVAGIKSVKAFEEAEAVSRKLGQVLTNMKVGNAAADVEKLADSLQRVTGIDDEVIKGGQTVLATFSSIAESAGEAGGTFERATKASLDLSSVFGGVEKSSLRVGKALQDPVKGITALGRAGVTFTADQKKLIESLVETGDVAGAQDVILKELEKRVGGTAEASATESAKISAAFGEIQESIGGLIASVSGGKLDNISDALFETANQIDRFANSEGLADFLDFLRYVDGRKPGPIDVPSPVIGEPLGEGSPLQPFTQTEISEAADEAGRSWMEKFAKGVVSAGKTVWASIFADADEQYQMYLDTQEEASNNFLDQWTDDIKEWAASIGDAFQDKWNETIEWFQETGDDFAEVFEGYKQSAQEKADEIGQFFKDLPGKIADTAEDWYDAGKDAIGSFLKGLASDAGGVVSDIEVIIKDALNSGLGLPRTLFGGKDGIPTITIPAFAGGVQNYAGGLALVGERGPEVVALPKGSDVYPSGTGPSAGLTYAPTFNGLMSTPDLIVDLDWWYRYGSTG